MGTWHETCAVTSTPIRGGDSVYVVRINRKVDLCGQPFGQLFHWGHLESVDKGTYNSYGWIEESKDPDDCYYIPDSEAEDGERFVDNRDRCFKVFVHHSVWERIQKDFDCEFDAERCLSMGFRFTGDEESDEEAIAKLRKPKPANWNEWLEFAAVVAFCSATRKDILSGFRFMGSQHCDPREYRILTEEIDKILTPIENEWRQFAKEHPEEAEELGRLI